MQLTAALRRINRMRFIVGPKANELTAIVNSPHKFAAVHSRGVEAATAASTHADYKDAEENFSRQHRSLALNRTSRKKIRLITDSGDLLNFEFTRNKNSMTVFMIRLRRVYRD
jgi:hypothetical protein